jgi:4-diphosphocytidyl-2-C-methyl-D-erythritol kinase
MTGVGETLLPLDLPKMPGVLVNPRVPVATSEVFTALGLRHGEMRVGAADVMRAVAWPEAGASFDDWISALAEGSNDLEAPAIRIQPVIEDVLSALRGAAGVRLARMSGSGATCFAIFGDNEAAQRAAQALQVAHPLWWVHAGTLG